MSKVPTPQQIIRSLNREINKCISNKLSVNEIVDSPSVDLYRRFYSLVSGFELKDQELKQMIKFKLSERKRK